MKALQKLKKLLPSNMMRYISRHMSDELYLRLVFREYMGRRLNLKNPVTFQEKLQWLKLYNRKDIYTKMVDKYEAKDYVKSIVGEKYIIPSYGVWNDANDIDFDTLPNQFVLKTTHDSGGIIICKDKKTFDKQKAIDFLNSRLKLDVFYSNREWPYKNVVPRIIAEKYICDDLKGELMDYKFFCFNGVPKYIKVDFNRFTDHHANFYDTDWKLQEFGQKIYPPQLDKIIEKPENFDEMLCIASKLSSNCPFLRVDLYNINGKIYFGELTFFHYSGMNLFIPDRWNKIMGDYIELPI